MTTAHPLGPLRTRTLETLRLNVAALGHILQPVSQAQATTLRDGPDGWTALEVVCHLRDLDDVFRERVTVTVAQDYPAYPPVEQERWAIERAYNQQDLRRAYQELCDRRQALIAAFQALSDEQWERAGQHPTRGHFSLTDTLTHTAWHDANHLEQLTRILTQAS